MKGEISENVKVLYFFTNNCRVTLQTPCKTKIRISILFFFAFVLVTSLSSLIIYLFLQIARKLTLENVIGIRFCAGLRFFIPWLEL